jgi:uncharacterized protein
MKTIQELAALTEEYGGRYGLTHSQRIIHIISIISENTYYDKEIIEIAAYLHDWGGYEKWKLSNKDHAIRSKEVAQVFLEENGYEKSKISKILECIEYHHNSQDNSSYETILLCDADAIDYLGLVGILREFSTKPRDLYNAYISIQNRKEKLKKIIKLKTSMILAKERIEYMEKLFIRFDEETYKII